MSQRKAKEYRRAMDQYHGVVEDVDTVRQKLTVKVKMFLGREMPVEVDLQDVEKVQPK